MFLYKTLLFKRVKNVSLAYDDQNKMLTLTHPRIRHVRSMSFFNLITNASEKSFRAQLSFVILTFVHKTSTS